MKNSRAESPAPVKAMMGPARLEIEHPCPQCGAPLSLAETDRLLSCPYCRVQSYLVTRAIPRYLLPHSAPQGRDLFYVPYWRLKGLLFTCLEEAIHRKIVDVSHQALETARFPPTLGLRSQTLKLRFLTAGEEGRFLAPQFPHDALLAGIKHRFNEGLSGPVYHQDFIGQSMSQIFAPFYGDGPVYDAILNRLVPGPDDGPFDPGAFKTVHPGREIRFLPALCPECGWDLEGGRDSLVLFCRNCKRAWQAGKKGFTQIEFFYLPGAGRADVLLPFYRIRADVEGIDLETYADLVKAANLPKVIRREWEDIPFRFWFPAFKVRPRDLLSFSLNLTLSRPVEGLLTDLPEGAQHPVTLSIREAAEGLKTTLASFVKPKRLVYPQLSHMHIRPRSYRLVYLPFQRRGNELSQPAYRLRINRNLLSFAGSL